MNTVLVLIVILLVLALLYMRRRHDFTNVFRVYAWDEKIRLGADSDGGYVIAELGPIYDCYIWIGTKVFLTSIEKNCICCYYDEFHSFVFLKSYV